MTKPIFFAFCYVFSILSLQFFRLVTICEKQLATLLTLKNVGEILQLSYDFNALQLKKCCLDFICCNFGALLETKGLDVVDDEVLEELSKHYQEINRPLSSRRITPYRLVLFQNLDIVFVNKGVVTKSVENHVLLGL